MSAHPIHALFSGSTGLLMESFFSKTLYLLVIINPASKILFLTAVEPPFSFKEILTLSVKSTVVAAVILAGAAFAGIFLFQTVFHVELYALNVAGGIILFIIGHRAVASGLFFTANSFKSGEDISIFPLASPLIVGPGTITTVIALAADQSALKAVAYSVAALLVNMGFMLVSPLLSGFFKKYNMASPLARFTGLMICAVSAQMALTGLAKWYGALFPR